MKSIYFIIAILLIITACDPDRKKKADPEQGKYETSDSSELFFKNMRQSYYDIEARREAGIEIFRLQDRLTDDSQPLLNLSIIYHWRIDEAFIYIEPNPFFTDSTQFTLVWQDTTLQQTGEYHFIKGNRETHYAVSAKIYNSLLDEHKLFYKLEEKLIPLLDTELEQDVFRVTMFDFFRLVDYFSKK